eukprot:1228085-Pleurochrysis_carterae.AAC.1
MPGTAPMAMAASRDPGCSSAVFPQMDAEQAPWGDGPGGAAHPPAPSAAEKIPQVPRARLYVQKTFIKLCSPHPQKATRPAFLGTFFLSAALPLRVQILQFYLGQSRLVENALRLAK